MSDNSKFKNLCDQENMGLFLEIRKLIRLRYIVVSTAERQQRRILG